MSLTHICIAALLIILTLAQLLAIWDMCRRARFGYPILTCMGGLICCAVSLALFVHFSATGCLANSSDLIRSCFCFPHYLAIVLSIPMLLMSALGLICGAKLLHDNGLYPANGLSICASLLWFALWGTHILIHQRGSSSPNWIVAVSAFDIVTSLVALVILSMFICNWLAALYVPRHRIDYLIILGCGLWSDGTPAPILRKRIDRALRFDTELRASGYEGPVFVASGGRGLDEPISESESIKRYLVLKGIEENRIVMEDRSTNTCENLAFSYDTIARHANTDPNVLHVAFVTTNYHVFRTYVLANREGVRVESVASPTTLRFWPNAFVRELIGLATLGL